MDNRVSHLALEMLTPLVLFWISAFVDLFTTAAHGGARIVDYVDSGITQIAAVGGGEESVRQLNVVVLESDTGERAGYVPTGSEEG